MKTDPLFYRLFQACPALALEAAGIVVADPQGYEFRAEEVKETAFRLDGLLMPPSTTPEAPLVLLETQMPDETAFCGRFWAELFLCLYRRTALDQAWQAIVIFPDRAAERPDARYASLFGLPIVHRIYLEDLADHPAPSVGLQLLRLVVAEPAVVRRQARQLAQQAHADPAAWLGGAVSLEPPNGAQRFPKKWFGANNGDDCL
jgi:predicted transposase YdaD